VPTRAVPFRYGCQCVGAVRDAVYWWGNRPIIAHVVDMASRASKRCPTCCGPRDVLPAEAFYRHPSRSDGLSSQCRACHHGVQRRYYDRNVELERLRTRRRARSVRAETRELVLRYLQEHPCLDCGERDPVVLQFHHVRGTKRDNVGSLVCDCYEWPVIAEEIAKCVVLCANCHWRRAAVKRGDYRARQAARQRDLDEGGDTR